MSKNKGKLFVLGIGPGNINYMTIKTRHLLETSDVIAGYKNYIELIAPFAINKEIISTGMTKEIERVDKAIEAAANGKTVSLVCSGDAGIYGMAGLVYERIESTGIDVEVEASPGVTAAIAAGSLLGSPLSNDFITISLSNLLTPTETVKKRIVSSAQSDMVTVVYNPISKKRKELIEFLSREFNKYRAKTTPVGIVTHAFREGQRKEIRTLDNFLEAEMDMNTVLILGNSDTCIINGNMVTKRGYDKKETQAILIAGAGSGTGKTTVSLGLMAAFKKQGLKVQGFKTGPDFIDPSLHRIITGRPSVNLDTWMMPADFLSRSFESRAASADISIIEGVMGLHDGRVPDSREGSTAELAATLDIPVILVLNAKSMARTAAAIINGLVDFDKKVNIKGIILNNIGSPNHLDILKKAISAYCSVPVLGGIPAVKKITLPSRHLGLFMGEDGVLENKIEILADTISNHVDLDRILTVSKIDIQGKPLFAAPPQTVKGTIAVARDKAFCFYYEDNFKILKQLGYRIIFFSPMEDKYLPEDADSIYFGGGYPELHAGQLTNNTEIRRSIKEESEKGTFIYAECGGLMYLGRTLTDADGTKHDMCGCMPYDTVMKTKFRSLGYTEVIPADDFLFIKKSENLRGHCFHYSEMIMDNNPEIHSVYQGTPPEKAKGFRYRNTLASYVHLHLGFHSAIKSNQDLNECLS